MIHKCCVLCDADRTQHFNTDRCDGKSGTQEPASMTDRDLRPYAGRWVALVGGRVAGVGLTAKEARMAAKLSRPKEEPGGAFCA